MNSSLRKTFLAIVSAGALVAATFVPAAADESQGDLIGGGNAPAGWTIDPSAYGQLFGPLGDGAPQGTMVVDSGFRPYPHGFPVPNWGSPLDFVGNQLAFGGADRVTLQDLQAGTVEAPAPMNSLSLRRTFGNGVCRDPKSIDPQTGQCELIFGAELLAQVVETTSLGGHCFGLAAAAAALYNGQLPANQVGATGLGINATNPMRQPATQTIERLFGTQLFNPAINEQATSDITPTQVVETLIRDLAGGTVPYILTVISAQGGHGITPFAVLDRGEGIFDIAVYDNNFPMRARAVTVDTNTDSFSYTSAINPSAPGITWSTDTESVLALVSVDATLAEQPCPVCLGPDQGTLLAFNSLSVENADKLDIFLVDESGDQLSEEFWREIAPLNPPTQERVSQPVIIVDPGVQFGLVVVTEKLASEQPLEIYAMSNGKAQYLLLDELRSNSTSLFGVRGLNGTEFFSDAPSSPRILQLSDQPGVSFDVNGHPLNLPANVEVKQRWNTETERVIYESNAKRTLRWNVQIGGLDDSGGREYVGLNVRVPAGGRIVVDYTNASATVPPKAWMRDADGNREPITMQPVTEQLINEYRDELYVSKGPG
jgi:hypothetical protein